MQQTRLAPFRVFPERDEHGKIEALPKETYDLIPQIRSEWIELVEKSGKCPTLEEIKPEIAWIYKQFLKTKSPPKEILIARSWKEYSKLVLGLEQKLDSQLRSQLDSQLGSQLRSQLRSQLDSQLGSQLGSQLRSQLSSQLRSQLWWEGMTNESWLSYWEFYIRAEILRSKLFDQYSAYLKQGIFNVIYLKDYCIICGCPKNVRRDDRGRLHSTSKGAIEWVNGDFDYFIHGISFPENIWSGIVQKTISARQAVELSNSEQRTIACQMLGYDTIIAELNAKKIHSTFRKVFGNEQKSLRYYLYEIDLRDDSMRGPAHFIKVECPSTGKETLLRVPPNVMKCDAALAWTFNQTVADYNRIEVET